MKPEREEFSSYIFNVYNILKDPDQWENDPYINGLRAVYRNAKLLSKALKRLATFIKKIIERMVQEETMESLTENILEYCEGDFIKEYARLTKQQNIHIYRSYIRLRLEEIQIVGETLQPFSRIQMPSSMIPLFFVIWRSSTRTSVPRSFSTSCFTSFPNTL